MTDRWIVIPKWDEFQHPDALRTGNIPWLKTFTRLLSDASYLDLNAGERAVLHGIWLEYARARGQLTVDTSSLTRRLSLRVTRQHLEALNHAGFIEFSASKPASTTASKPASVDKKRVEKSSSTSKAGATPQQLRCPSCTSLTFKHERELRDHLDNVHWLEGDQLDQAVAQAVEAASAT